MTGYGPPDDPSEAPTGYYDYSDGELEALAGPIREIAQRVGRTQVIFNNCYEDAAQRNALSMMRILRDSDVAWPGLG